MTNPTLDRAPNRATQREAQHTAQRLADLDGKTYSVIRLTDTDYAVRVGHPSDFPHVDRERIVWIAQP